jgi:hypothetical protein
MTWHVTAETGSAASPSVSLAGASPPRPLHGFQAAIDGAHEEAFSGKERRKKKLNNSPRRIAT